MANTTTTPTGATGPALNLQQAMNSGGLSFASPPTTPVPTPTPVPIPGQSSVQPTGGTPFSLTGTMNTPQAPQAPSSTPGTTGGSTGGTPQTQFSQNQTPNQLPNQTPTQGDPTALSQAMLAIQNQVSNSNNLVAQKNLILKQLYDQPLSDADKAQLDPALASVLASGDRNAIDFNLKLLNDQIAGRTNTLAQNVQYLTQGYNTAVQQATQQKQDAITNVLNYARANGQKPSVILQALYPDLAKQLGPTLDQIAAPYSTTSQITTGGNGYANNDPIRITQNNNPIAVAMATGSSGNEFTQALDAAGIPWQQGSAFSDNPNMSTISILGDPIEASRAVLANTGAIQNWYINHSGANILAQYGVKNNQDFQKLSTADQNAVIQGIYQGEGGQGNLLGTKGVYGSFNTTDASIPDPQTANIPIAALDGRTAGAITQNAISYALQGGNLQQFVGGLSASNPKTQAIKNAIDNKAAALASAVGTTLPELRQAYSAASGALKTQISYLNNVDRALQAGDAGGKQVLQAFADKGINPNDATYANRLLNDLSKNFTNSADLRAYQAGLQEVANEYQQVFSRGGATGVTDNVRNTANSILDGNISLGDLSKVLDELQKQGQIAVQASVNQVNNLDTTGTLANFYQLVNGKSNSNSSDSGTTVMTGPDGQQWNVPSDKVNIFKQNGYK